MTWLPGFLTDVVIALIAGGFVLLVGGPSWAGASTFLIVFNIGRAANWAKAEKP